MKRRAKEKERKQKERERKQRLNEIQGQYKPRYRHNRDGTNNPDPAVVMKGKSLFRTIAFTVIATFRLRKWMPKWTSRTVWQNKRMSRRIVAPS